MFLVMVHKLGILLAHNGVGVLELLVTALMGLLVCHRLMVMLCVFLGELVGL